MTMQRLTRGRLQALHIAPPQDVNVAFYEFERSPYLEYWDVVSLEQGRENPLLLELRLLHIDEELLRDDQDDPDKLSVQEPETPFRFDAFNEAQGFMSPTPAEFMGFIQLLETRTDQPLPHAEDPITRFRHIERDALTHWHVKSTNPKAEDIWYEYLPDVDVTRANEITLVYPPRWRANSRYGLEQHSRLEIVTFQQQRLADPAFDPLDEWGAGRIVLNRPALREFISLLKQHRFQYIAGDSEP